MYLLRSSALEQFNTFPVHRRTSGGRQEEG